MRFAASRNRSASALALRVLAATWVVCMVSFGSALAQEAEREVAEVELLTPKALAGYFPHSEIWAERLAGLAKSITAIKQ